MSTQPSHQNCAALEKLDHGMQYKLVLLVAPTGTGKAQVVKEWVNLSENLLLFKPIYLTLGPEDNRPGRFLSNLLEKFQLWDPDFEDPSIFQNSLDQISWDEFEPITISGLGLPASIEDPIIELINRLMPLQGDRLLIMHNFHLIENPGIHSMVAYLIDYLPPNIHLVITSQVIPPLQIAKLRARRELLEIGPEDL